MMGPRLVTAEILEFGFGPMDRIDTTVVLEFTHRTLE